MVQFSDKPEHRYPITLTLPYAYTGTNFEGIPEYVDCADRGDTFVGICRDLSVCVSAGTSMRDAVGKSELKADFRFLTLFASISLANILYTYVVSFWSRMRR